MNLKLLKGAAVFKTKKLQLEKTVRIVLNLLYLFLKSKDFTFMYLSETV